MTAVIASGGVTGSGASDHAQDKVLAGALNWLAVLAAVSVAALLAEIHGPLAWPLVSFSATAIYLLGAACQLAWANAWRNRSGAA